MLANRFFICFHLFSKRSIHKLSSLLDEDILDTLGNGIWKAHGRQARPLRRLGRATLLCLTLATQVTLYDKVLSIVGHFE